VRFHFELQQVFLFGFIFSLEATPPASGCRLLVLIGRSKVKAEQQ
jgi:hypothetical protein